MELEHATAPDKAPLKARAKEFLRLFLEGARLPWQGLQFLLRHRSLWHYAILPMVINLLITLSILLAVGILGVRMAMWFHHWPHFAGSVGGRIQETLLDIVLFATLLGVAAGSFLLLGGILSSFFNERLARQVEILLGTPASELAEAPLRQQALDALRGFLTVAATAAGCFVLGCIPLVGIAAGIIAFYIDFFVFGYEYFEIPLSLRGLRRKEKRALARRHRPRVLGLGAIVFLMNMVPLAGSVFLTTAAVGAVLLHKRLRETP
ncbi:MAG TPA: EI24 domain-containing protein [Phycisphaerae bacterium]|nr:EI24 domain-containing protein [Phycisphaerae bacterium]